MEIRFTPRGFGRGYGLPEARLINMLVEATPAGPGETARYSRPALVRAAGAGNIGVGPNRGVFQQAGSFSGHTFVAQQDAIYAGFTNLGSIDGTDYVRSAASTTQRVFAANKRAYLYDGTVPFSRIAGAPATIDVLYTAGRFLYLQSGTGRFYYSEVNDAANIGGLNFEDAELRSDPLIGGLVNGDTFQLFQSNTVEAWQPTGDLNTPFERIPGRAFERGCASRDSILLVDNTAFWLGDDRIVYRAANVPVRISTHSIEDQLRDCTSIGQVAGWRAVFEGHPLYGLNIPGVGTEVFDVSSGEWNPWESYGYTGFRASSMVQPNGLIYAGDTATNDVWNLSRGHYTDDGDPLVRIASAFIPVESGHPRCNRIAMACAAGVGNSAEPDPVVEMRYSDDGLTWSLWRQGALGETGQYGRKVYWNRLGRMTSPGRTVEFRCADAVLATFAELEVNGGRP